ncbi:MAG: putative zinc-binding protein [Dehalococcoidales bacterium]|nr:putative zinc-binding protein [Dehalococcoidales bacterium]
MKTSTSEKVLLVPCSGIGKVHGLIAREAVYRALENTDPDKADTMCLSLLVTADKDTVAAIRHHRCITVDGCPKLCAYKNLEIAGGKVAQSVRVVDAFKGHKGARPGDGTALTDEGWQIAEEIAQDLTNKVNQLLTAGKEK